jgi:hypothetical protein
VLALEIQLVDTNVLQELEEGSVAEGIKVSIEPSWKTIQVIRDKYVQNKHLFDDGVLAIETPTEDGLR